MDVITTQFDGWKTVGGRERAAIRYGLRRGQELLNKYYSKTDESVLYRVALRKIKVELLQFERPDKLTVKL